MNTNKKNARNLADVRIVLSALWAARMLSSLQGDVMRFMQPGMLEEMISGTTDVPVTNELLLVMSVIMAVPIFMSFLSLTLKDKANRLANLQDVLLLAGAEDHIIPLKEYHNTMNGLPNARSVTDRIFTADEHAQNHCQVGNIKLAMDVILQWVEDKS